MGEDLGVQQRRAAAGIAGCRSRDWPPTLPEFMKLCRPPIDHQAALLEAIEQMAWRESGRDRWSHPAIYWAAVKIGAYDLGRKTLGSDAEWWRKAFGDQMALGQWPEIPGATPGTSCARTDALSRGWERNDTGHAGEAQERRRSSLQGVRRWRLTQFGRPDPLFVVGQEAAVPMRA